MKVLFLDFDGVLNGSDYLTHLEYDGPLGVAVELDPKAVVKLNTIVGSTGADIVISSTWRLLHPLDELEQILVARKFVYPEKILGVTPCHSDRGRGGEIQAWLHDHSWDEYAVVDDDVSDMGVLDQSRIVKTVFMDGGMKDEHMDRIIEILGVP